MTFSSLVLTGLIGAAAAQLPKPCLYPEQFTAQTHRFNYAKNVLERGEVVYDARGERLFETETFKGVDNPGEKSYEILYLFAEGVHYKVDRETRECYGPIAIPNHQRFSRFGVAKNATFHAAVTEGVTPNVIDIHQFGIRNQPNFDGSTQSAWYHVTAAECMPTQIFHFYTIKDQPDVLDLEKSETTNFYDVVLGIEDPNVFIPPRDCIPPPEPPTKTCSSELNKLCEKERSSKTACDACLRKNAAALTKATCTRQAESAFCGF
jgi:hypothetical protein